MSLQELAAVLPPPAEPKFTLPGFFFAYSTSSARLLTGSEGCTASTSGTRTTSVISAASLFTS